MSGQPTPIISAEEWILEEQAKMGEGAPRERDSVPLIRVDDQVHARQTPLIILVPGFLADAPSGEGPVAMDQLSSSEAYSAADWVARGRELAVLSGCEVLLFAWPNGGTLVSSLADLWKGVREKLGQTIVKGGILAAIAFEIIAPIVAAWVLYTAADKWRRAKANADRTPMLLHQFLTQEYVLGRKVLVVGHSLGGRIALNTSFLYHTAGGVRGNVMLATFVALAPAIGAGELSAEFKRRTTPIASVGYSPWDIVLQTLFRVGAPLQGAALGVRPHSALCGALKFVDCTSVRESVLTSGHLAYTEDLYGHLCAIPSAHEFFEAAKSTSQA